MALAINPIINIPRVLKINETGMNNEVFVLENPIIIIPNSSGSGEAIINAPRKNVNHLKNFNLKIDVILYFFDCCFNK